MNITDLLADHLPWQVTSDESSRGGSAAAISDTERVAPDIERELKLMMGEEG